MANGKSKPAVEKAEFKLSGEEKKRFDEREVQLRNKIYDFKYKLKEIDPQNATYEKIAEHCCIGVDSLKKVIAGTQDITKGFLLRFTYGMRMSVEEANEYFELFEGKLNGEERIEDLAFINAVRDGDSIFEFDQELKEIMSSDIPTEGCISTRCRIR